MGIYLDNAATSYPKPEAVIKAVKNYMTNIGANAGRSAYLQAIEASRLVFETREAVARLIHVRDSSRIIFTANATEALNLAIIGFNLRNGDVVLTSGLEHNAVMRPLRQIEKEKKIRIGIIRTSRTGEIDLDDLKNKINRKTRLIAINHASNVIGTIQQIREIGKIAGRCNIPLLVDAAQSIGHLEIDVEKDNIDLLAFSGHKGLYGPQGIGCLYIKEGIELRPLKFGGTGSNSESQLQPDFLPDKYESGTLNLPGIAGLKAGVEFITKIGVGKIRSHIQSLTKRLFNKLSEIEEIVIYGPLKTEKCTGVVSITMKNRTPDEIGRFLDNQYNLSVRVGLHCSPQTHKTIGTFPKGTVRISPGFFNKDKDIDSLVEALCAIGG